ncbi:hypothetical protein WJX77_003790 [Trebouxia sp. C0004]
MDLITALPETQSATYTQEMQQTLERAKDCLTRAQQRQKAYADKGRHDASYQGCADAAHLQVFAVPYRHQVIQ